MTTAGESSPATRSSIERRLLSWTAHWPAWLRSSLRPIMLYLASRALVFSVALAASRAGGRTLARVVNGWDSHWYLNIAQQGYVNHLPHGVGDDSQANLGFFPLTAIADHIAHAVTGLGYVMAGSLTVNVVGLFGAIAFWWLLRSQFDSAGADRGTALMVFSPAAFVFSYVYSEAFVVLFTSCVLLALAHRRWILAGIAAGLCSACDPVAAAIVIPCVIAAYGAIKRDRDWKALFAPLLAPAGIAAFFIYLWVHVGTPFAWFKYQRAGWQRGYYGTGIPKALWSFFAHGFQNLNPPVKSLTVVVAVILVVIFVRAKPPMTWRGYVFGVLAMGAISPTIGMTPRLLLRDAPILGVAGARLSQRSYPYVLSFSVAGLCLLTVLAATPRWTP